MFSMLQYIQGVRNEDRQADRNPLRSAATGNDHSTGVSRKIWGFQKNHQQRYRSTLQGRDTDPDHAGSRRWDPHHGGIFHGQNAAEQLQKTGNVTTRKMMGEYCVYYNGKMVGDICDNTLLLKPTEAAIRLLPAPKKKK